MKTITESELKLLSHRQQVQFALFCAKQAKTLWNGKPACVAAIATVEAWLEGKATAEECKNAAYAAYTAAYTAAYAAAYNAAYNAAYAASYAAYAAANAAADAAYAAANAAAKADYAAAKEKIIAEQWEHYYSLLGELGKILYF